MRILLVTHYYPPEVGPPQQRWDAFVERFIAAGHQVAVLAPAPHYPRSVRYDVEHRQRAGTTHAGRHGEVVHRLRHVEPGHGIASRALDQLVTAVDATVRGGLRFRGRNRPDIVVATAPGLPSIGAGLGLSRLTGAPVVLEMRDAWPDLLAHHQEWDDRKHVPVRDGGDDRALASSLARRALTRALTSAQRGADGVVTTTDAFTRALRSRGVAPVATVRNGTHRTESGWPVAAPTTEPGPLRVLYLGTVGRSQGLGPAVQAAAALARQGVDIQLRIVGEGVSVDVLREFAEELSAPVDLLPVVPPAEVRTHYQWADTVLVSLRPWGPFAWTVPSKVYEVLSSGRHITAAMQGEAAGIVEASRAGHVVAPGDVDALTALWRRLASNRSLLDIGEQGRAWVVEHADSDDLARNYLSLLEDVRHSHRSSRASELVRNTGLLVRTAVAHAADDPLLLMIQVSRRLPAQVTQLIARALLRGADTEHAGLRVTYALWLAGREKEAAEVLVRGGMPSAWLQRRLAAELAVQLGRTDDVPGGAVEFSLVVTARTAWRRGDVSGAVDALSAHRHGSWFHQRLVSERQIMQPGYRLVGPAPAALAPVSAEPAALHVLTNSVPRTQSGYAIRSHEVLKAQRDAGIRVAAVTRIGYPVSVGLPFARHRDVVDGITYRRIVPARMASTPAARLEQMVAELTPLVEQFRPSVLHTTTHFTNALVAEAVAEATDLPWVYEVRGLLEDSWLARQSTADRAHAATSERYRLLKAKETEMAMAADHVVTLSQTLRDDLIARGVESERITVVPNAVDASLLQQARDAADAREELGLPREGIWVGTVSSLVAYEGMDDMVEAVRLVRAAGIDVRACIVGDGVSRPGLIEQVRRAGLQDVVLLPGRVDREQARNYHQALDVFVVPRKDYLVCRTVTPLKPIEAMALGRPVVASDVPALAELVGDPGTGLLVPPENPVALAETLAGLADAPQVRADLGTAGRSFAAGRTWDRHGRAYREVYAGLAGKPRTRTGHRHPQNRILPGPMVQTDEV